MLEYKSLDFEHFRSWLKLNLEGLTWEGKYQDEFEKFWTHFFSDGISLSKLSDRFKLACREVKVGPLISWFDWLKEKLICYSFVYKEISLIELSRQTNLPESYVGSVLRYFFIERYPHLEHELSDYFQTSNLLSRNIDTTFKILSEELNISNSFFGSSEDDLMNSLEVTLYPEWMTYLDKLVETANKGKEEYKVFVKNKRVKKQLQFFKELVALLLVGGIIILGLRYGNKVYEQYLADKINILQPDFLWLDRSLSFKLESNASTDDLKIASNELEKIEKIESNQANLEDFEFEERTGPESEVVLTSVDALPKGFAGVGFERSEYEEETLVNYRDTRFGRRKAFRVMMKTADTEVLKEKLNKLLEEHQVTQVDQVKPGTDVPGGIYYNLYVPNESLQGFLSDVSVMGESILYESRTRGKVPPGQNKVFLWLKKI